MLKIDKVKRYKTFKDILIDIEQITPQNILNDIKNLNYILNIG